MLKPIFEFDYWGLPIYWIMLAVGFLFAFGSLRKKQKAAWCQPAIRSKTRWVFLLAAAASLVSANVIGWILHPEYLRLPVADRFELAGFSFYYAVLGFLAVSALLLRISRLNVKFWIDHIVPSILIANMFGRIGCVLAGCCYGADITLAGLTFAFPAPALEALAALIMLVVFSKAIKQHRAFWYLACYSILRFVLEFGRADDRGFLFVSWLSPAQVTSIIIWIGLAAYVVIMKFVLHKNPLEKYNEFEIWNSMATQVFKQTRYKGLKKFLALVLVGSFALAIWNPLQITAIDSAKQSALNIFNRVGSTRSQVDVIATSNGASARVLNQETVTSKEEALAIMQSADPDVGGVFEISSQEQLANGNQLYTAQQMYRGKPILNSGRQVVVAPNNTASYMVGESIPLSGANRSRESGAAKNSGPEVIKEFFGDSITVKSTVEGYYYTPGILRGDTLRDADKVVFELANGTALSALIDRNSGGIIALGPDSHAANFNAVLNNITQATEAFLNPENASDAINVHSDRQALESAFAAITRNRNIGEEAFADILTSSLTVAQGVATPNLSLYRDILLQESKSYYINQGQSEREAQRCANTVDRALRQAGIRQVEDTSFVSIAMADTTVKTKGSIRYSGNSNAMLLSADAGRAQTFTITTNVPLIVTVMDEANLRVLSMPVERNETFRIYPINDNETFHIIISENSLAPGIGDYSITIQPDRAPEQRERVPNYITTKLRQVENAYNTSNASRFVSQLHFLNSGEDSPIMTYASTGLMTMLAGTSSFVMKSCYGCVGLDKELLDGDKMMIAQILTLKNDVPNIPQEIAEALKDTYLTMRYERHVEHEKGSYVKATMEIGMLDALDASPILKHTVYMEIRHIDNEEIARQAVQALGITNDRLRRALPLLFSGYYICDDFNSDRVRRGLGVSDEELAQDAAASFNLYKFWNDKSVKAGSREIWLKEFPRAAVAVFGHWSAEELDAFEEFTLRYNISILKNEIRVLESENLWLALAPEIIAGGSEISDIIMLLTVLVNPTAALLKEILVSPIEGVFLDALLNDMRASAAMQIRKNKDDIAAIQALLREMDPNYAEYENERTDFADNVPSPLALGLTEADYASIFSSNGNAYDWNLAYWAALASFDTYMPILRYSESYKAMEHMGFGNIVPIPYNEDEIKAVYGLQELKAPINGKSYIVMVTFRGTYYGENGKDMRNLDTDLDYYPVTWYKQPSGNTYPPGQRLSENSTINAYCVHGGFYRYINQFIKHDFSKDGWFMYPGKQILLSDCLFLIAGHSLGGAMAELYTLRLSELGVRNEDVICYGVASPPCAPKETQQYAMERGISKRIHKLYHNKDITPHAGYYTYTLAQNPISFGDSSKTIFSKKFTEYHGKETYLPYILEHLS